MNAFHRGGAIILHPLYRAALIMMTVGTPSLPSIIPHMFANAALTQGNTNMLRKDRHGKVVTAEKDKSFRMLRRGKNNIFLDDLEKSSKDTARSRSKAKKSKKGKQQNGKVTTLGKERKRAKRGKQADKEGLTPTHRPSSKETHQPSLKEPLVLSTFCKILCRHFLTLIFIILILLLLYVHLTRSNLSTIIIIIIIQTRRTYITGHMCTQTVCQVD